MLRGHVVTADAGALFEMEPDLAAIAQGGDGAVSREFGGNPFTVLRSDTGPWQRRKRWWVDQGIQSEVGRAARAYDIREWAAAGVPEKSMDSDTSIFDPVLAEMLYRWLCPPGGMILDPFAGGSVRGVVAGSGGFRYHGIELRAEQVEANTVQRNSILGESDIVTWIEGDAADHIDAAPAADLLFTCPPYFDLEVYSDDPADLSAMRTYDDFLVAYRRILAGSVERLDSDRFAVVVVGDFRDKRTGYMRPFVADTIRAMEDAGAHYYQEIVIVNPIGSLPVRIGKQFTTSRKFGKHHQQALVFVKGDPKVATRAIDAENAEATS